MVAIRKARRRATGAEVEIQIMLAARMVQESDPEFPIVLFELIRWLDRAGLRLQKDQLGIPAAALATLHAQLGIPTVPKKRKSA